MSRSLSCFQDSHGIEEMNAAPVTDTSQDVRVLGGSQNETHTTVTFSRNWQTCDPQDRPLTVSDERLKNGYTNITRNELLDTVGIAFNDFIFN